MAKGYPIFAALRPDEVDDTTPEERAAVSTLDLNTFARQFPNLAMDYIAKEFNKGKRFNAHNRRIEYDRHLKALRVVFGGPKEEQK